MLGSAFPVIDRNLGGDYTRPCFCGYRLSAYALRGDRCSSDGISPLSDLQKKEAVEATG